MVELEQQGTMPYQGNRRTFGKFICDECTRSWMSAYTWKNTGQDCKGCNNHVYPCKQWPLKKPKANVKVDKKKPHEIALCGKCRELGRHCGVGTDQRRQR